MKKVQAIIIGIMAVIGISTAPLPVLAAGTVDSIKEGVDKIGGNDSQPQLEEAIKDIVNVMLFILGAIAVVMIVIGGIRYTTSNGDANSIKGAKDTILYAVVGLVVAILAYAIVNFVLGAFSGDN